MPNPRNSSTTSVTSTYGHDWVDLYDDWSRPPSDAAAAVAVLAEMAGEGRVLEIGMGAGQLAVPLAQHSLDVHGVEPSAAAVRRLRERLGGQQVTAVIGPVRDVPVQGRFSLIYVVGNVLFSLPTQDDQITCLTNAARRLATDGRLVVECFVPDIGGFGEKNERVSPWVLDEGEARFHLTHHDPVRQMIHGHTVRVATDGTRMFPGRVRYAWPSEIDLMARLAGLSLRSRWGGWRGEEFAATSRRHISVYTFT